MVNKLTNAVINNLQTSNKTVVGALNELNSKTRITGITPGVFSQDGEIYLYKISPQLADQSILCICRSEVYLITLGQRGNRFNTCYIKKILDAPNITDATAKLDEEGRNIIFTCGAYENPVFVGRF